VVSILLFGFFLFLARPFDTIGIAKYFAPPRSSVTFAHVIVFLSQSYFEIFLCAFHTPKSLHYQAAGYIVQCGQPIAETPLKPCNRIQKAAGEPCGTLAANMRRRGQIRKISQRIAILIESAPASPSFKSIFAQGIHRTGFDTFAAFFPGFQ
jgi:hypothetical protein